MADPYDQGDQPPLGDDEEVFGAVGGLAAHSAGGRVYRGAEANLDPTLRGLFCDSGSLPSLSHRGELRSSHVHQGASFVQQRAAVETFLERDPHRLSMMGTTRGDALAWVQRMKDHGGQRRIISSLSNVDVRHLATNLNVEAASRRLPTDKKLVWEQDKWYADTRKSMIDCIWRMCEVKKKDGSNSARARKDQPNKQTSIRQGASVTEGGGADPTELDTDLNVDPNFDENADDPDLENVNEPGPDGTPVSDEERLRLLEIARGLHDTLFEPIPGSVDHDGMRDVRIKAERDAFNSRSKAARGTETTAYKRFCFWMATQPLDDPDRADTIDLGRLFEYMQWVALLKVKGKGTLLSANTLKGQWTMANRFKLRQEAARGKSNDRGMTLARVQKYLSGLYRGAAQAGHDNLSYGVLANTGLYEGSHHAWDHNKATYKFLRRKVMYEKAMVRGKGTGGEKVGERAVEVDETQPNRWCFGSWLRQYAIVLLCFGTLARGNTVVNIRLCHVVLWSLSMPPLLTETVYDDLNPTAAPTAREQWGIMVIATAGKVLSGTDRKEGGKDVNGILPHKYAGQCTIGALAIYMHWQYDEYDQRRNSHVKPTFFTRAIAEMNTKLGREAGVQPIDWFDDSTLRQTRLCSSGESNTIVPPSHAVARAGFVVYKWIGLLFSSKVMHYARSAQTRILEQELGCPAADIKRIGHWVVETCDVVYLCKTPAKAVLAIAGFSPGEPYIVPRLSIRPPEDLQRLIFPWLDEPNLAAALDHERHVAPDGRKISKDTAAHLLGLRKLRSFLLLHLAKVYRHAPKSPLFVELPLFRNEGGTEALAWICDEYPTLLKEALSLVKKDPQVLKHAAEQKEAKLRRDVATQMQETQYHAAVERRADREEIKADVKMHMDSIDTKLDAVLQALTGGPFSGPSSSSEEAASTSGPLAGVVQPTPGALIAMPSTPSGTNGAEAPSASQVYRLPPPDAFCRDVSGRAITVPEIMELAKAPSGSFDWRKLLNNVVSPNKLWLVYRPKDMAAYKTIQEIVDDWEAERLVGNEKLPPLSMLDELFPQFETEMRVVENYYKVKNNLVPPSPPKSSRSSQEAAVKESWRKESDIVLGGSTKLWAKFITIIRAREYKAHEIAHRAGRPEVNAVARSEAQQQLELRFQNAKMSINQFVTKVVTNDADAPKRPNAKKRKSSETDV